MTEVRFYHLTRTALAQALPELLERIVGRGSRAVVMAGSEERVEAMNALLWTYSQRGFLPHGSARDGFAAEQPVWLTAKEENPNGADVLVLTDGAGVGRLDAFQICCELFDGNDPGSVAAARARWKAYAADGHTVAYYQQGANGPWEKKA
ncbi:MAG: DNA polymerase III subunit chi [Alphaproteobacteria bacterium]